MLRPPAPGKHWRSIVTILFVQSTSPTTSPVVMSRMHRRPSAGKARSRKPARCPEARAFGLTGEAI